MYLGVFRTRENNGQAGWVYCAESIAALYNGPFWRVRRPDGRPCKHFVTVSHGPSNLSTLAQLVRVPGPSMDG